MNGDTNVVPMKGKAQAAKEARDRAEAWVRENMLDRAQLAALPDPEWIIAGIYVKGTLALVNGDSGTGKSFVVLDQVLHAATGRPWQGRKTLKGSVLYLCGEGVHGVDARVSAWETEHNNGRQIPLNALRVFRDVTPLTRKSGESERLLALVAAIRDLDPDVIVVDTLARYAGGVEENSAADMGMVVEVADQIAKARDATVIIVHHTARGQSHGRGSTALRGAMETELLVQRTKGMAGTITVTKQKNAADGEEIPFELVPKAGSLVVRVGAEASGSVDPFLQPVGLVTKASTQYKRVAWILWSIWHDTERGATKSEVSKALSQDSDLRLPVTRQSKAFSEAWSILERKKYLDQGESSARFLLNDRAIQDLNFTPELLQYVLSSAGHRGGGDDDE